MPEAVRFFSETRAFGGVRDIHKEILNAFVLDFARHAPAQDIPKLNLIWESLPSQLARENKRFLFSALNKTARARDYENALQWLQDAGLILRASLIKTAKLPLSAYADRSIFKACVLDVGLMGALAKLSPEVLVQDEQVFAEFKGALVENYVAQQLLAHKETELYYWKSDGAAEIDLEFNGFASAPATKRGRGVSGRKVAKILPFLSELSPAGSVWRRRRYEHRQRRGSFCLQKRSVCHWSNRR